MLLDKYNSPCLETDAASKKERKKKVYMWKLYVYDLWHQRHTFPHKLSSLAPGVRLLKLSYFE